MDATTPVTSPHGSLDVTQPTADTLCVRLSGQWTMQAILPSPAEVQARCDAAPGARRLSFEASDLADWDRGGATSAPGQSGQPGSPHYDDLLPLWQRGEYFPLAFSRARVEEVTRHRLKLTPAGR